MNRFSTYWEDTLNLVLGVALFVSPLVLGFTSVPAAATNAYIVGVIIAAMALAALFAFQAWEEWVSAILGVWLVISPWVLGFSSQGSAMLTHLLIGIATVFLAQLASSEHYSGHSAT
jgi:hypothetical protein